MKKILVVLLFPLFIQAQNTEQYPVLDEIIAVVGDEIALLSELKLQKSQALSQGVINNDDLDCIIFENLLFEKLLLNQAKIDSVEVSDAQVQGELDRRIAVFSQQLGGQEQLEEFYGKSIEQIKSDFYASLKDQLLIRNMQTRINSDVYITPEDVEQFYSEMPKDSIPLINSEVEISQIVIKPEASNEEKEKVKAQLQDYRNSVLEGKDFSTYAVLYSQDPGSAANGGELGLVGRGTMVKEFESVAYNLAEGEVSNVFETEFGFHIMQLIERRGNLFNARHILLKPKLNPADLTDAKNMCDSISNLIQLDSLTFPQAALRFSEDEGTKFSNGAIINPATGSVRFDMSDIDPQVFFAIDKMEVGEISEPVIMQYPNGNQAYRIIWLKYRSEPHRANLKEDYQLIQEMTRNKLSAESVNDWIKIHVGSTYVKLNSEFEKCQFEYEWIKSQ